MDFDAHQFAIDWILSPLIWLFLWAVFCWNGERAMLREQGRLSPWLTDTDRVARLFTWLSTAYICSAFLRGWLQ